MGDSSAPFSNAALADALLRGSILSRCRQAPIALIAMILNAALCILLLGRGLSSLAAAAWVLPSTALLLVRYRISKQAAGVETLPRDMLRKMDRQFRIISVASQMVTGAGIWLALGTHDVIAAYLITLLICLYGVGTMINLAHDFRSVWLSLPLLMGQPALYWLIYGEEGIAIAVILLGLTYMMISSAGNSQRQFDESITIRFQKDDLVNQLEQEKRNALASLREAEAANRSKSFFMAAASHDLRQPLYAATILHNALALQALSPDAARLVEQQGKALDVASDLFDNLLDLSRFESGTVKTDLRAIYLDEMLKDLETEFRPQCAVRELTLHVEPTPAVVRSDYDLLTRTIRNLLSNAVRYTARGGITIACVRAGPDVLLSVRDTGIGISPTDRDRIFTEFVQLNNPQRSRDRGVGLGLAIVRHITALLNHEVRVESEPGKGTTITVRLPAIEPEPVMPLPPAVREAALPDLSLSLAGHTVWIVEDDELVSAALQAYFSQLGCAHRTATSGADLKRLEQESRYPDFAILDDMLGVEETGLELARHLGSRMSADRILLTTGNVSTARWRELSESGFAVLRKPVSALALSSWLRLRA